MPDSYALYLTQHRALGVAVAETDVGVRITSVPAAEVAVRKANAALSISFPYLSNSFQFFKDWKELWALFGERQAATRREQPLTGIA